MDSNQTLKLTGMLDQKKTKKQMSSDIRQLERIVAALRVTGVFAEAETKRELEACLEQIQARVDHTKLSVKIDTKQLDNEINRLLSGVSLKDIDALDIDENKLAFKIKKVFANLQVFFSRNPIPAALTVARKSVRALAASLRDCLSVAELIRPRTFSASSKREGEELIFVFPLM